MSADERGYDGMIYLRLFAFICGCKKDDEI